MTTEEIRFQIDQLRKDKIIYATEAAATSMTGMLVFVGLEILTLQFPFLRTHLLIIAVASVLIPLGYFIYMGTGNFLRLKKIRKLEKELYDEKEVNNLVKKRK